MCGCAADTDSHNRSRSLKSEYEFLSIRERGLLVSARLWITWQPSKGLPWTAGGFLNFDHRRSHKPPAIKETMSVGEDDFVDVHLFRGVDRVPVSKLAGVAVRYDDGLRFTIHDGAIDVPRARAGLGSPEEDITYTTLLRRIGSQPNGIVFSAAAAVCKRL